jgi:hypothetical protein
MNKLISINKIKPIREGKVDDLFITASSFEERCRRVPQLIDDILCKNSIIFLYKDVRDDPIGNENTKYIYNILKEASINKPEWLPCDFSDPYSILFEFCKWLKKKEEELENCYISIDISCFTKLHLLLLLKYIGNKNKKGIIRFLYTQPLTYLPMHIRRKKLSYDLGERCFISYVPHFVTNGKEALVIFLGMEGLRVNRIWEETDAEKTILIRGKPGFTPEMEKLSERENEYLLSRVKYDPSFSCVDSSTLNPWNVVYTLEELIVKKLKEENFYTFYIAPCGTQLQTIGIYFFSQRIKDCKIVIAYFPPKKYAKPYSEGIRDTLSFYWVASLASLDWPLFNLGIKGEVQRDKLYEEILFNRY